MRTTESISTNWNPQLCLATSNLSAINDYKEEMAPFTKELCMDLAKDWESEETDPAEAGGTVGPGAATHHQGEPADAPSIWAVICLVSNQIQQSSEH